MRFSHTKTALCDRKDTQSRFAVNAACGIMCVGTAGVLPISFSSMIAHASFFFNDVFTPVRGRADAFPKVYMLPFILLSTSIHFLFIMSFAGENLYGAIADKINETVFFINPSAP